MKNSMSILVTAAPLESNGKGPKGPVSRSADGAGRRADTLAGTGSWARR